MDELRGFTTILRAFHEAREELYGHVEGIWHSHYFGGDGATMGPHVYLDAPTTVFACGPISRWPSGSRGPTA
ncbi:hypothetical protein [Actinoplanes sp. NPDC026623]|uniref:hypothetical protein n=1 Tax=Actinoplanes sp. NPDC026623 TaxID=3155610 RepID=UPI0033E82233